MDEDVVCRDGDCQGEEGHEGHGGGNTLSLNKGGRIKGQNGVGRGGRRGRKGQNVAEWSMQWEKVGNMGKKENEGAERDKKE